MKIAFYFANFTEMRTLGGLVDECLVRQHKVAIISNYCATNYKPGIIRLSLEKSPVFKNGSPDFIELYEMAQLPRIIQKKKFDAICMHTGIPEHLHLLEKEDNVVFQLQKTREKTKLISIASHFFDNCIWPLEAFDFFDAVTVLSDYSVNIHKKILYQTKKQKSVIDKIFETKVFVTGSAFFDNLNSNFESLRQKNGVKDKILYMTPKFTSEYEKTVLTKHRILNLLKSLRFHPGNIFYLKDCLTSITFERFLRLLKNCSIENNLKLIFKSRLKNIPLYDDLFNTLGEKHYKEVEKEHYPLPLSQKLLLESKCCFSIKSFSVIESVVAGTPAVNIHIPIKDKTHIERDPTGIYRNELRGIQPGSINNFPGCSTSVHWKDLKNFLKNYSFSNTTDEDKRVEYISHFCGIDNKQTAAVRQIDVVENML